MPWRAGPEDGEAKALLAKVAVAGPSRQSLRALQRYAVPVPRTLYRAWLAAGELARVHPALGDALLQLNDDALYDSATGLRVFDPAHRDSASNVF